jgi:hypothetical protein
MSTNALYFPRRSTAELEHIFRVAKENKVPARVIGKGDVPSELVVIDGWRYEPLSNESKLIPLAAQRAQMFLNAGVRPKGFMVRHELPPTPAGPKKKGVLYKRWLIIAGVALTIVASGIGIVVVLAAVVAAIFHALAALISTIVTALVYGLAIVGGLLATIAVGLVLVMLLPGLIVLDPALIMVLEDGTQIEVCRWDE